MFISLILSLAVNVRAEQNTEVSYRQLREGIAATLNVGQIKTRQLELEQTRKDLLDAWNAVVDRDRCPQFSDTLERLTAEIDSTFGAWQRATEPDEALLNKTRLAVLIPVVSSLHDMFKIKVEAGYGSLDHIPAPSCLRDRKSVEIPFETYEQDLKKFANEALGVPGFLSLTRDEDELLRIAGQDEIKRGRYNLEFMAITTGTSIALWALAPYVAAAITARAALISVPQILKGAAMIRGAQLLGTPLALRGGIVGLTMVENLSYNAIDQQLSPAAGEVTPNRMHAYGEYLESYNNLIDAPLRSPELDFIYLSGIKSLLVQTQAHWLNEHHAELNLGSEWHTVVAEARESIASGGTGILDAQTEIRDRLHDEYKLDVTCKTGFFRGLTEPDCLRGLRQVLRALQTTSQSVASASIGHVFSVRVSDQFHVSESSDNVVLEVPVDAETPTLALQIAKIRTSSAVFARTLTLEALNEDTVKLQSVLGPKIEFDASLTNADRWRTVRQLISIFQLHPNLVTRAADVLRVSPLPSGLVEKHLGIEENINANADDRTLLNYLSLPPDATFLERIASLRRDLNQIENSLRERHGWDADCNSRGRLTLRMCLATLKRVQAYLDAQTDIKARPGDVLVADLADIDQTIIHLPESNVSAPTLVIRTDFYPAQLIGYGLRVGWLQPVGAK